MNEPSTSGAGSAGGAGGHSGPDASRAATDPPGRIVSLAPSATATLSAFGVGERIVGVTTHCDLDRPTVGGWLTPDYDRLADLDPDLVCTCDDLQTSIRDDLRERGFDVHHVAPSTLPEVLASFEALGTAAGRAEAAADLVAAFDDRLAGLPERSRERCRRRLDDHREFVAAREADGNPPGHEAAHYDFPVVTKQERQIRLYAVDAVEEQSAPGDDRRYAVEHVPV